MAAVNPNATIHKQELPLVSGITLWLPVDARLLHVAVQYGRPCLWYWTADPDGSRAQFNFTWYGTGHACSHDPDNYVGTVLLEEGTLVLHLFKDA
jgi:hypothetical protein